MYNRYIRSEAGEIPFANNFIPVSRPEENFQNDDFENQDAAEQSINTIESICTDESADERQTLEQNEKLDREKKTSSFLTNLFDLKKINTDTLIVLGIALFILCDNKEDTGDVLLILAVLLLLGF